MNVTALKKSNNSFIDENHEILLASMEFLERRLSDAWAHKTFTVSTNEFINFLENHFVHEETLLRGAGFTELDLHTIEHRQIALDLRNSALKIETHEQANDFVTQARSQVLSHELIYDLAYQDILEPLPAHDEILIHWTAELETGRTEVDVHHRALANFLNRFHMIFFGGASRIRACAELRSLHAYTKMHFGEEEDEMGELINPAHVAKHEQLLHDLSLLISEVEDGGYDVGNISSHLKYWFLDHLRFFDIPAFKETE